TKRGRGGPTSGGMVDQRRPRRAFRRPDSRFFCVPRPPIRRNLDLWRPRMPGGYMTTDEKLKLAVSVARAAARSGEYRRLDKLIEIVFRKLNELAPSDGGEIPLHDRDFKL